MVRLASEVKRLAKRRLRVIVTGASGFVGTHLIRRLASTGYSVGAIVRHPLRLAGVDVYKYAGELADLRAAMGVALPDCVVHLASLFLASHEPNDVCRLVDSNVLFGTQLLEVMSEYGCNRLVNFGTAWQHFSGTDDYEPVSLYAATKQAFQDIANYYVSAKRFRCVTLKLSDTYGPDDHRGKLVSALISAVKTGHVLQLSPGEQLINLVHISDVCRAVEVAMERTSHMRDGEAQAFSVRGEPEHTLRDLVKLLGQVVGKAVPAEFGVRPYRDREVMVPWRGPLLPGWSPKIELSTGLREIYDSLPSDRH